MSRISRQLLLVVTLGALVAGCQTAPPQISAPVSKPKPNGVYKVGDPYQIGGTWYYPHEQPDYDETGVASWYGPGFYGRSTANGEIYQPGDLSAAHRTLPMPVNVRVINLENGRSMVLRVNDRGPFAKGRIIDVSETAAKALGFHEQGVTKVRVQYIGVADINGKPASTTPEYVATAVASAPPARIESGSLDSVPGAKSEAPRHIAPRVVAQTSPVLPPPPKPTGQVSEVAVPTATHLYVQVGAFGNYENARRLMLSLATSGMKVYPVQRGNQTIYRVRLGPFETEADAEAAMNRVFARGSKDAQIVVDQ